MMNRRSKTFGGMLAFVCILLLSGCLRGELRTETVIIPDEEEGNDAGHVNEPFDVKSIYRLPVADDTNADMLGWSGKDVIRLYWEAEGAQGVERYAAPFDSPGSALKIEQGVYLSGLSPDGGKALGMTKSDGGFSLATITLADMRMKIVNAVHSTERWIYASPFSWSNNSRFISYFVQERNGTTIAVYDTTTDTEKNYQLKEPEGNAYFISVKPSDDGTSALIVTKKDGMITIRLGNWNAGQFEAEYEHSLGLNLQADWIDNDRVAFVGTDGTLFTYDRRNARLAVLNEKVAGFQLSPDRQYLAFSTDDDAIRVAKLQGNNLLNEKTVYQGVVPAQLAWSADNGKLLIRGRKPYPRVKTEPAPVSDNRESQLLIVEFR